MYMRYQEEENNYPKAILLSSLIVLLFLLTSYFIVIHEPFKQEDIGFGGIIVNYGTSEEGMGADNMSVEEPSVNPDANHALPDKVTKNTNPIKNPSAETSDKDIVTQDNEEAPSVIKKNSETTHAVSTNKTPKENKPILNPNALYKGAKNDGQTRGDGTGNIPGNQGSKNGDPLATNYGEGGSGAGNVSLSLVNRRFINTPKIDDQGQSAGKIVVEIRVDKTGEVVFARAGAKGTTLSDLNLWHKCESAVLGAKLNQLDSAPEVQLGTVVFNFKVK